MPILLYGLSDFTKLHANFALQKIQMADAVNLSSQKTGAIIQT